MFEEINGLENYPLNAVGKEKPEQTGEKEADEQKPGICRTTAYKVYVAHSKEQPGRDK